ncbi:unnamed protein product, partial [Notodromas monacha]
MDKYGRRWVNVLNLFIAGLGCSLVAMTPKEHWLVVVWSILGKFGSSGGFVLIYQQGCEIFPTVLRSTGLGFMSLVGAAVNTGVPQLVFLGEVYHYSIPYVTFGIMSMVGVVFAAFLPETLNKDLPETVEDSETFGLDQTFWSWNLSPKPGEGPKAEATQESSEGDLASATETYLAKQAPNGVQRVSLKNPSLGFSGLFLLLIDFLMYPGFDRMKHVPPMAICLAIFMTLLHWRAIYPGYEDPWDMCVSAERVLDDGDVACLFLSSFEHAGFLHLFCNMVSFVWTAACLEHSLHPLYFLYLLVSLAWICNLVEIGMAEFTSNYLHDEMARYAYVLFALKILLVCSPATHDKWREGVLLKHLPYPSLSLVTLEFALLHLFVPEASLQSHLAGVIVGMLYVAGPLSIPLNAIWTWATLGWGCCCGQMDQPLFRMLGMQVDESGDVVKAGAITGDKHHQQQQQTKGNKVSTFRIIRKYLAGAGEETEAEDDSLSSTEDDFSASEAKEKHKLGTHSKQQCHNNKRLKSALRRRGQSSVVKKVRIVDPPSTKEAGGKQDLSSGRVVHPPPAPKFPPPVTYSTTSSSSIRAGITQPYLPVQEFRSNF